VHVYRWDLDRTYLDTDIHSVRGLLRSAMETADEKRTVPGAPALLRGLVDHDPSARVEILSGSPVQMREVLEQKLQLDGVRFDSLVLKDNLRNLRRGRFRAIRGQLGYKLPQLLALRLSQPAEARETLFGDDAEVDALVYALYADIVAGRVDEAAVAKVLRRGGAYGDQVDHALRSMRRITRSDAVESIFIHVERGVPLQTFDRLGSLVIPVFSWFQAALVLTRRRRLGIDSVEAVVRASSRAGEHPRAWVAWATDALRRGLCDEDTLRDVFARTPSLAHLDEILDRSICLLGDWRRPDISAEHRDYLGFLESATTPD
jgi:hypothetical protein